MNVIKLSTMNGSFCSTDIKTISKRLKEQIESTIKSKLEEKFVVEVFDINNIQYSIGSKFSEKDIGI